MEAQVEPLIEMESVDLDFGNGAGLFNISLRLPPGTILGMIGPSGCGKTTLVRILTGLYRPAAGRARVFGKPPSEFTESDKMCIGYIPQQMILYDHLSAEENLNVIGGLYGMSPRRRKERIREQLEFVELADAHNRLVRHLSGGMKRRLMLASALLHDPVLIFADEPTAGLDPILRAHVWQKFRELRETGRTLLVTTQFVSEAGNCDRVAVMRHGRILTTDTPANLRRLATGGEIIYLRVVLEQMFHAMEFIAGLPYVTKVEQVEGEPGGIRVVVPDASACLPELLTTLHDAAGIVPEVAEPRPLPFDEVFVRLVQQSGGDAEYENLDG